MVTFDMLANTDNLEEAKQKQDENTHSPSLSHTHTHTHRTVEVVNMNSWNSWHICVGKI